MSQIHKRKTIVTDPFQMRIFVRILTYGFIYQLTVWNLMFGWQLAGGSNESLMAQYCAFFYRSYPMLLCLLVLAPVFAWDAVRFCHRVTGPLVRFRSTMRKIAAGEPVGLISLRKGDELTGLQNDFNMMLTALAARSAIQLNEPGQQPGASTPTDEEFVELSQDAISI